MPKKPYLTPEERYANRRVSMENYRHRVRRFTLQFSLQDTEALEWFEQQPDKGKYLKGLMLADKAKQLGEPETVSDLYDFEELEVEEMSVDYKELLGDKVQTEYDNFVAELKKMSAEKVLEHAYEKVFKEDLVVCIQNGNLSAIEAKALYLKDYPLDYCYREWLDNDCSYMEMLRDTIDDAAKDAVRKMKEKNRESR